MSSRCLINHTTLGSTPPSQRLVPACQGIVSREVQAHQRCHVELEIQKGIGERQGPSIPMVFPFSVSLKKKAFACPMSAWCWTRKWRVPSS